MRTRFAPALLAVFVAMAGPGVRAQGAPAPSAEGVQVSLITVGQGRQVFERFGHNALRFQNLRTGEDVAYHWGLFDFEEPGFLVRFLTGDTRYSMGAVSAPALIEHERRMGRPVTIQRLNLTSEQVQALSDFVRWNALEENRYYRYDYFADNCSTRLRDALDRALGGALERASGSRVTTLSYRRESVRLTDGDKPVQAGIDIALGRPADVRLNLWQSFFIPMRLRDGLREVRTPGPDGAETPLVASEEVLEGVPGVEAVVEKRASPRLAVRFGVLGLLLAALVVVLRIMAVSRRGAAWGLALFGGMWSFLCGVIGVLLLLAWTATRHVFWAMNENVLLFTPFSLALALMVPAVLLSGKGARGGRMLAALVGAAGVVALLLAILPGGQENRAVVALVLPVHLALAWALALPDVLRAGSIQQRTAPTQ